jgi:hypothetical protein
MLFCHFWIELSGDTSDKFPSVVRSIGLLSRLDQFDKCFSDVSAADSLENFDGFLVVLWQETSVSERHSASMKHFILLCVTAMVNTKRSSGA